MLLMDAPPEIPRWLAALEKRFTEPEELTVFQKEWFAPSQPRSRPLLRWWSLASSPYLLAPDGDVMSKPQDPEPPTVEQLTEYARSLLRSPIDPEPKVTARVDPDDPSLVHISYTAPSPVLFLPIKLEV